MRTFRSADKLTASGISHAGECLLGGLLLGTDGVNDPTITVYDGLDNTGREIVPTTTYDASALGLNGYTGTIELCRTGVYIEISCAGTVEVVAKIMERQNWGVA